jgi:hypothetical protein
MAGAASPPARFRSRSSSQAIQEPSGHACPEQPDHSPNEIRPMRSLIIEGALQLASAVLSNEKITRPLTV